MKVRLMLITLLRKPIIHKAYTLLLLVMWYLWRRKGSIRLLPSGWLKLLSKLIRKLLMFRNFCHSSIGNFGPKIGFRYKQQLCYLRPKHPNFCKTTQWWQLPACTTANKSTTQKNPHLTQNSPSSYRRLQTIPS